MSAVFSVIPQIQELTTLQRNLASNLAEGLALQSADRGTDATGIAWVDNIIDTHFRQESWMYKNIFSPQQILSTHDWETTLESIPNTVGIILGHTRKHIVGENSMNNAQPHVFRMFNKTLYGVMDGFIAKSQDISLSCKSSKYLPYINSSANLFCALSMFGRLYFEDILRHICQWNVAMIFTVGDKMYYYRSKASALVSGYAGEIDSIVLASTKIILQKACDMSGVRVTNIRDITPDVLIGRSLGESTTVTVACPRG